MTKMRSSNLELCRIITMLLIVFNHVVTLGQTIDKVSIDGNTILSLVMLLGGKFGTNVFLILGVYFLIDSEFKVSRVVRLWFQTLFYMVVLNIVGLVFFRAEITTTMWVKSLLPVIGNNYWYASSYIILLLAIPFINRAWGKITIRKWQIALAIIVCSIIPTITLNGSLLGDSLLVDVYMKLIKRGPIWFIFVYILMKYIKENYATHKWLHAKARTYFFVFLTAYVIMFGLELVFYVKGIQGNAFALDSYIKVRDMPSILCLIAAGAFFLFFKNIQIPYNKWINLIAADTFGVYLLHNHALSIPIFWHGVSNLSNMAKTAIFPLYAIFIAVMIFVVGMMMEYVRKRIEVGVQHRCLSPTMYN